MHSRAKSMNEITVTLSFNNTHTIYKKVKIFEIFFFNFKIWKISEKNKNVKKFQNFQESYVLKQLLHLNLNDMRFYGAEYNNIELCFASFNIVVLCSIKPHIDLVHCILFSNWYMIYKICYIWLNGWLLWKKNLMYTDE